MVLYRVFDGNFQKIVSLATEQKAAIMLLMAYISVQNVARVLTELDITHKSFVYIFWDKFLK